MRSTGTQVIMMISDGRTIQAGEHEEVDEKAGEHDDVEQEAPPNR
jgi:hypothetical protein